MSKHLPCYGGIFDWDNALVRLDELNAAAENPELWSNSDQARQTMQERQILEESINFVKTTATELADNIELLNLGESEGDNDLVTEAENSLQMLSESVAKRQLESLLSGEVDANDCYLEIHPGAGGTESMDWASMLFRMYLRWSKRREFKITILDLQEEAELTKSVTMLINGYNAYGWLKFESGVHRLVRISPFDSQSRRHTSFASVWCYPVIDDSIEISVSESDCRIDTYRASGAGGQHINKTDSAVRITHNPTGIVVQCQKERSQHANREIAWKMLKSRLYEVELQRREQEAKDIASAKTEIGWGHQIRSYVLQPYQLVKDLRTGVESSTPNDVLDGDLDNFLVASLAQRLGENDKEKN